LELVVDVTDGFNSNIFPLNSCEADVTLSDLLPVGVCAELLSAINNQVNNSSTLILINVFDQAVSVLPLLHFQHITSQELFTVVVTV